jgi:hypothetical protein
VSAVRAAGLVRGLVFSGPELRLSAGDAVVHGGCGPGSDRPQEETIIVPKSTVTRSIQRNGAVHRVDTFLGGCLFASVLSEVDMRPGAVRQPREEVRRLESSDRLYTKADKDEER